MRKLTLQLVFAVTMGALCVGMAGCSSDAPDAETAKTTVNPGQAGYEKGKLRKVKAPQAGGGPAAPGGAPAAAGE